MVRAPLVIGGIAALTALGVLGGYEYRWREHPTTTQVADQPCLSGGAPQAEKFQPYVLVNQPAPKPEHVTDYHRHLRLTPHNGHEYLAVASGRYFDVGRDHEGHIFPAYYDQVTSQYYPLYYDHNCDRYYRVCQDDGRYYQSYVDDPDSRFYSCDEDYDYADYAPPVDDCPIITDPYCSFTYYSEPEYYYDPVVYDQRWRHDDWLWAAPVFIGAYFVLDRRPGPAHCWYYGYDGGAYITPDVLSVTLWNAPVTYYNGGHRFSYYDTVEPPPTMMAPRSYWPRYDGVAMRYAGRLSDPYGHFEQHSQFAMALDPRSGDPVDPAGHRANASFSGGNMGYGFRNGASVGGFRTASGTFPGTPVQEASGRVAWANQQAFGRRGAIASNQGQSTLTPSGNASVASRGGRSAMAQVASARRAGHGANAAMGGHGHGFARTANGTVGFHGAADRGQAGGNGRARLAQSGGARIAHGGGAQYGARHGFHGGSAAPTRYARASGYHMASSHAAYSHRSSGSGMASGFHGYATHRPSYGHTAFNAGGSFESHSYRGGGESGYHAREFHVSPSEPAHGFSDGGGFRNFGGGCGFGGGFHNFGGGGGFQPRGGGGGGGRPAFNGGGGGHGGGNDRNRR